MAYMQNTVARRQAAPPTTRVAITAEDNDAANRRDEQEVDERPNKGHHHFNSHDITSKADTDMELGPVVNHSWQKRPKFWDRRAEEQSGRWGYGWTFVWQFTMLIMGWIVNTTYRDAIANCDAHMCDLTYRQRRRAREKLANFKQIQKQKDTVKQEAETVYQHGAELGDMHRMSGNLLNCWINHHLDEVLMQYLYCCLQRDFGEAQHTANAAKAHGH